MHLKKVLVATDFGELSERALDLAIELAAAFGASVTAVHAFELPMYGLGATAVLAATWASQAERASTEALDAALEKRKGRGVSLTGIVRKGDARGEILTVASEIGADLLVIGTHGRKGLERILLGSVALRSGRCVTVVDVRSHGEFGGSTGRIEGARSLPMHQLIARREELECHRYEPIVVVSGRGIRARVAAHALAYAGFAEVTFLDGGMKRWLELGHPVEHGRESLSTSSPDLDTDPVHA